MKADTSKRWNKTARVLLKDVSRAVFWYEVKLWAKIFGILIPITALAIWALIEWLDRR